MRQVLFSALILFSSSLLATAACEGNACYEGVLRDCVRLQSGDRVWVNHNPYTRCSQQKPLPSNTPRPQFKFNPPPKKKLIEPPSPYITPAERSAHEAQCAALRQKSIAEQEAIFSANCASVSGDPDLSRKAAVVARERRFIIAKCAQLGPMENQTIWPVVGVCN